jgi:hypothetical protein
MPELQPQEEVLWVLLESKWQTNRTLFFIIIFSTTYFKIDEVGSLYKKTGSFEHNQV